MLYAKEPDLSALPSRSALLKRLIGAVLGAGLVATTVVMPAEYGINPTGVGSVLGLTEMGEIKRELAHEAAKDHAGLLPSLFGMMVGAAHAQTVEVWRDQIEFTLAPGESAEWKMEMTRGQTAFFRMVVTGGRINFDMHGHGDAGDAVTYEKARGSTGSEGPLLATFDGDHGWFWRNRDTVDVTVALSLRGEYVTLKQEQ